jgi:hypothetical protein
MLRISKAAVRPFEVDEEILSYRSFHLPTEVANRFPVIRVGLFGGPLREGRFGDLAGLRALFASWRLRLSDE